LLCARAWQAAREHGRGASAAAKGERNKPGSMKKRASRSLGAVDRGA